MMTNQWMNQQIQRFLDEAAEAISRLDWQTAYERAQAVLGLDPENADGLALRGATERNLGIDSTTKLEGIYLSPLS